MHLPLDHLISMHDSLLVGLSILLCVFASATAMSLAARARANSGLAAALWTVGAALAFGCAIWGTHFVSMLAFNPGFPVAYNVWITLLSVLVSIAVSGVALVLALRPNTKRLDMPTFGGCVMGMGIAVTHFIGAGAVEGPATLQWNTAGVVCAVLAGMGLSAIAFRMALRPSSLRRYAGSTFIFAAGVLVTHFIGMSAETFNYDPSLPIPADAESSHVLLAMAVAATVARIIALGLVGVLIDKRLEQRNEGEALRLRENIAELEATRSDLEQVSNKLRVALATAAAASEAKSEFLASMSHELRTPLNAIIGFSEVMGAETFGPLGSQRYKDYATDIHDSGMHLLALINDILDLSRLDAGALTLHEEDFDLHDVIVQALRMVARQAKGSGISLIEELPASLPPVHADERRIKQVLINLLVNAIKFTPRNGSITVKAWQHDQGLSIAVTDTGIGIAPEHIAKALEPFSQIDASVARKHGGAGLGLPLSSQLMQVHGGSLKLESIPQVGTTVTITLPEFRLLKPGARCAAE